MFRQLELADFMTAVISKISAETGIPCYDVLPSSVQERCYYVEIAEKNPMHSKTLYRDQMVLYFHPLVEDNSEMNQVYNLIQSLEEVLTEDITLSDRYQLLSQENNGIKKIEVDDTRKQRIVVSYSFTICYGQEKINQEE